MGNPRKACVNCHFFSRVFSIDKDYKPIHTEANSDFRERIKKKDYYLLEWSDPACYFGVWDEADWDATKDQKMIKAGYTVIVETERSNCFFFEYRPGMGFEAGAELEKREALLQSSQNKLKSNNAETVAYDWSIKNIKEVNCNGQLIVKLPHLQFKLFECLYKKSGKYVKNETLEKCWGDKKPNYENYLSTEMSKIGSKLIKGLEKNNIKVNGNVIEPKKENRRNTSYKLVTKSSTLSTNTYLTNQS